MNTNRGDLDDMAVARDVEDYFCVTNPSEKRMVALSRDGIQVKLLESEYLELLAEQGLERPRDRLLSDMDIELLKRASERKGMTALARELTKLIPTDFSSKEAAAADIQEFFRP